MRNALPAWQAIEEWPQAQLVARLGIPRQTVISIECGRFDLLSLAFLIAATFGCTIEEIFTPGPQLVD